MRTCNSGLSCMSAYKSSDLLTYHIQTDDLYADMQLRPEMCDTSNFEPSHPLFSVKNKKVVGKFKVETGSAAPIEFVGLRAKLYSLLVVKGEDDDKNYNTDAKDGGSSEIDGKMNDVGDNVEDDGCSESDGKVKEKTKEKVKNALKGIPKTYVRKYVRHERFRAALRCKNKTQDTAKFRCFRTKNHVLKTMQIQKVCLNSWDDKRYIKDDGIATLAHGHVRIRKGLC